MSLFLQELPKLDKELLRLLTENLPDMLWIKDIDGKYLYANKAICDGLLMAKDIEEPIGKNDIFFATRERELHKEIPNWHTFGELCFNSDIVVIEANKAMKFEEWGNVKGELLYLEVNKAPFYNEKGEIIGTVGAGRDITELKLSQIELAKQARIIEQIHECIITTNLNGDILSWNNASQKLFGYSLEETHKKNISLIFDKFEFETIKNINILDLEKKTFDKEMKFITKNSKNLICDLSLSLLKNNENEIKRIIFCIKDITDEINLSQEIKHQEHIINMQAQHVAMGQMIGNIAHQWRQPLSVISTAVTGLEVQKELGIISDEEIDFALKNIIKQTDYLSHTIDTFRDFIKNDKVLRNVILQDRINNALEILEAPLASNHIKLINEIDYSKPLNIRLITGELSQVIINLVNNAKDILLETKKEKPWIKISLQNKNDWATIIIEDNGDGIPTEIIDKIFEPYFTTKQNSKGTGLGLYMSYKIIAESLKGRLFVENSEYGAKFFIELPLN